MKLFDKIFGTYSEREIKKIVKLTDAVEDLSDEYKALSDTELASKTTVLKERLANGETLDDILPEAFALVREADTLPEHLASVRSECRSWVVFFFIKEELPK